MATQAQAEDHRTAVENVVTLAVADLVAEWATLPEDPQELAGDLAAVMTDLIGDYSSLVADLAVDWYDDLRIDADVPGSFVATPAPMAPLEQIERSASWAARGAYVDLDKALSDSAAALDRLVADRDRASIAMNIDLDPAEPRWGRYASAGACAFCALYATRGPAFRSEETAARRYHERCRCIAVPSWSPSDFEEAPYVADWREAYYAAAKDLGRGADFKAILAHMRANSGLR